MNQRLILRIKRELRGLSRSWNDFLCPANCAACGEPLAWDGLCKGCRWRLELRPKPWCPRCGSPIFTSGARCLEDHRGIRGLLMYRAPFRYRGAGGDVIRRFKFQGDRAALRLMARAMSSAIEPWTRTVGRRSCFVSVPMHAVKLRKRGVDHAALLADAVARRVGRQYLPRALIRTRATLPQGDVRVTSRSENVRDAFAVRASSVIRDAVVVLVDDVRTSGHTSMECARALRSAGARGVTLLTAAQS